MAGNCQHLKVVEASKLIKRVLIIFIIAVIFLISGCAAKVPPLPIVVSGTTKIPVVQSSYSWGKLGSADYAGGVDMVKGKTPSIVSSGADIKVYFDYKPRPSKINIQQFQNDRTIEVPFKDGLIKAPIEKGIYYYGISAFWFTDDGKYSKGDTSSAFIIEVR